MCRCFHSTVWSAQAVTLFKSCVLGRNSRKISSRNPALVQCHLCECICVCECLWKVYLRGWERWALICFFACLGDFLLVLTCEALWVSFLFAWEVQSASASIVTNGHHLKKESQGLHRETTSKLSLTPTATPELTSWVMWPRRETEQGLTFTLKLGNLMPLSHIWNGKEN